jgi:hypothetical protein
MNSSASERENILVAEYFSVLDALNRNRVWYAVSHELKIIRQLICTAIPDYYISIAIFLLTISVLLYCL